MINHFWLGQILAIHVNITTLKFQELMCHVYTHTYIEHIQHILRPFIIVQRIPGAPGIVGMHNIIVFKDDNNSV